MYRLVAVGNWLGDGEHPGLHAGPRRASKKKARSREKQAKSKTKMTEAREVSDEGQCLAAASKAGG